MRSVVATWRKATARRIPGYEAFRLLLHATRFGTVEAVPNLVLSSGDFCEAAQRQMCEWVCNLARLPKEEIEDFLSPPSMDGHVRDVRWNNVRLA